MRTLAHVLAAHDIARVVFLIDESCDNFVCFYKANGKPSSLEGFVYIDHFDKVIDTVRFCNHSERYRTATIEFVCAGKRWHISKAQTKTMIRQEYETDDGFVEEWSRTIDPTPAIDLDAALFAFRAALRLPE